MKPQVITHFMHTRGGAIVLWLIALLSSYYAMTKGDIVAIAGQGGVALPSANTWLQGGGWASWGVSMVVNAGIAVLAIVINRTFNVLRSMTMLFGGLYGLMMMSTPSLFGQLYGGTIVALALVLCQMILYSIYGAPDQTRRVFLMFFIMSLTALVARAALFYLPVLLIGCVQMRVFTRRTFLAALIGIITPAWILLGFGVVSLDHFAWPNLENIFPLLESGEIVPLIATVGFTVILGLVATLANLVKMLGYNTHTRALNGFITVTLLATVVLILFDMEDALIYVPVLNLLSAVQVANLMARHIKAGRSFIIIWVIAIIYLALFFWSL